MAGFGLYIHWPFCQSKCPYCDFNSHVAADIDQDRWRHAYEMEVRRAAQETPGRVLTSVFFGGGTPSLMSASLVSSVLETISDCWPLANDAEITLEANPSSVEAARFRSYREAGVNRVSLGIQSLRDPDLVALGRLHSADEALRALDTARQTFDRVSFDLIYARQHQDLQTWQHELRRALSFDPTHLSLYQLTIEPGTAFGARHSAGRLSGLPNDDLAADLYFATQDHCEAAGLPAYETSNHASPGHESRHNLIYWRAGDYLGIGPGAHGRLTLDGQRYATETQRHPETWLRAVEGSEAADARTALTLEETALEYALMSLRLAEGMDLARFKGLGGALNEDRVSSYIGLGLLEQLADRLGVTPKGQPVLNGILRDIL